VGDGARGIEQRQKREQHGGNREEHLVGGGENEREIRGNEVGRGSDSSHNPRQLLGQKDLEKNGHADERKEERDTEDHRTCVETDESVGRNMNGRATYF
jgi:hypothetical protein